jgi:CrcB protein
MTYFLISIGAVLGANLRYLVGGWVADRLGPAFPFGTLVINVTGSLVIGFVLTLASERLVAPWVRTAVAIGFLGSYTTFSTFSYETMALIEDGALLRAVANVGASVGVALVGVYLGMVLARAIPMR